MGEKRKYSQAMGGNSHSSNNVFPNGNIQQLSLILASGGELTEDQLVQVDNTYQALLFLFNELEDRIEDPVLDEALTTPVATRRRVEPIPPTPDGRRQRSIAIPGTRGVNLSERYVFRQAPIAEENLQKTLDAIVRNNVR